uniref:Retrotransposon Copia-like N-terminal domain-containing protein n=1 Tax=Chenopodium quinoa TaxID=63459 RepID=A0A803LCR8_CHEQI
MSKDTIIPYADPYYLGSSDHSSTTLGSIIFNGNNYLNWSRSVKMALGAKNKLGFINGKISKPSPDSDDYEKWIRNDYMIRCWLSASVSPSIAQQLLLCESSKAFWDELLEIYGEINAPQLYLLKKELNNLQQNDLSVGDYYAKLRSYWDEINNLEPLPECSCGAMRYDNMKGNILAMDPLPTVNKAFHMIQQSEKQKEISVAMEMGADVSAMAATKQGGGSFHQNNCNTGKGHTMEGCFKLHGFPDWFKNPPKPKGKNSQGTGTSHAANAMNTQETCVQDTPVDDLGQSDGIVNVVVQQVLKVMNAKKQEAAGSSGTKQHISNFA